MFEIFCQSLSARLWKLSYILYNARKYSYLSMRDRLSLVFYNLKIFADKIADKFIQDPETETFIKKILLGLCTSCKTYVKMRPLALVGQICPSSFLWLKTNFSSIFPCIAEYGSEHQNKFLTFFVTILSCEVTYRNMNWSKKKLPFTCTWKKGHNRIAVILHYLPWFIMYDNKLTATLNQSKRN